MGWLEYGAMHSIRIHSDSQMLHMLLTMAGIAEEDFPEIVGTIDTDNNEELLKGFLIILHYYRAEIPPILKDYEKKFFSETQLEQMYFMFSDNVD